VKTYPYYEIWIDHRTGAYEVARWDAPGEAVVVQTNLGTREKAQAACAEWERREAEKSS